MPKDRDITKAVDPTPMKVPDNRVVETGISMGDREEEVMPDGRRFMRIVKPGRTIRRRVG